MKIGIHGSVWVAGWSEPECREALERTRAAGYDFIEVPLLDPDTVDAAMTARLLGEVGLEATTSLGLNLAADVSSDDPEIVSRGEELLDRALAVSKEIGASHMTGILYGALNKHPAPLTDAGRRNSVTAVRRLVDKAREAGVALGLEAVNRYESNMLNTAEQVLSYLDEVGADDVSVHLDTYHMNVEESDLRSAVRACGDRLGYVHVGENNRGFLGSGSIDFPGLFRELVQIGYDGPLAFESFSSAVVSEDFTAALAIWRDFWQDGGPIAEHARRFIDEQLEAARAATGA